MPSGCAGAGCCCVLAAENRPSSGHASFDARSANSTTALDPNLARAAQRHYARRQPQSLRYAANAAARTKPWSAEPASMRASDHYAVPPSVTANHYESLDVHNEEIGECNNAQARNGKKFKFFWQIENNAKMNRKCVFVTAFW